MERALRRVLPDDSSWIHRACQDAEIQRWTTVPRPYGEEDARAFTRLAADADVWIVTADGDGVGTIAVHSVDAISGAAEIGYWIAPWARGRGTARWAVESVVALLRGRSGVRAVTATIADANTASQRVVASAGFGPTRSGREATEYGQTVPATCWSLMI